MASMFLMLLLLFTLHSPTIHLVSSSTDPNDVSVLLALRSQWENTPSSWRKSIDPCGAEWEGVTCNNQSRVVALSLSSMELKGSLTGDVGQLSELTSLDLSCNPGLTGLVPPRLGNLSKLSKLFLEGCGFSGNIPPELGNLAELDILELNSNYFTGEIPNSLGFLSKVTLLDLSDNQLSGSIPVSSASAPGLDRLVNAQHLHLDKNKLSGSIPPQLFHPNMTIIHLLLNENQLTGGIPPTVGLVKTLEVLNLTYNKLTGPIPDLTAKNSLNLILTGNPICNTAKFSNATFCQPQQQTPKPYSTSIPNCGTRSCRVPQKLSPLSCECAQPLEGTLVFEAPHFKDLSNSDMFHKLETSLWQTFGLKPGSVSLHNISFNSDNNLEVHVELFPWTGVYFDRAEVTKIDSSMTNHSFQPPSHFGSYDFIRIPYVFPDKKTGSSFSLPVIIGVIAACAFLVLLVVGVGIYALKQRYRNGRASGVNRPYVSWGSSGKYDGDVPQFKGARYFPYKELMECTDRFSERNEIGIGGFGKVYRGVLANGQQVAVKRSVKESKQGEREFKTEIELLSRVHHKNLVSLLGFCVEQGEKMLVYEYMPNGSLKESLSGKSGIYLDWRMRLLIALGSARGIAYLHDHADPPIIHRDIKSANVLLDENLTAKVADFGVSKLVADNGKAYVDTQVKGTPGYLDPEYFNTQQLTEKSDVYSFGVLMLELITAKQPIEMGRYIVSEAKTHINKDDIELWGLSEMIDPCLKNLPNLYGFRKFVQLAMRCVEETSLERPTMSDVVKEIEIILQNDDGIDTGSTTASTTTSSSITSFGAMKKAPYDVLLGKQGGTDSNVFEYSGEFMAPTNIEPK